MNERKYKHGKVHNRKYVDVLLRQVNRGHEEKYISTVADNDHIAGEGDAEVGTPEGGISRNEATEVQHLGVESHEIMPDGSTI